MMDSNVARRSRSQTICKRLTAQFARRHGCAFQCQSTGTGHRHLRFVIEAAFTAWSGAGRLRHPVHLGLREDKAPAEVVREVADPEAERSTFKAPARQPATRPAARWKGAVPPRRPA